MDGPEYKYRVVIEGLTEKQCIEYSRFTNKGLQDIMSNVICRVERYNPDGVPV